MNWVEVDSLGMAGTSFTGSEAALRMHLLSGVGGAGSISSDEEVVYLASVKAKVKRTVVTLTAPWGEWRYIADPP